VYFWVYGFRKGQSSTPFCGESERGGRGAGRWKRDAVGVDGAWTRLKTPIGWWGKISCARDRSATPLQNLLEEFGRS
jgi:hypothetical protein